MERRIAKQTGYLLLVAAQLRHPGGPMLFGALHTQGVPAAVGGEDWSSIGWTTCRRAEIDLLGADGANVEAIVVHG